MRRLLLDTTFLIDTMRDAEMVADLIRDTDDAAMAAVTVAELLVGVELTQESIRTVRQSMVEEAISTIPAIDYDVSVASHHAALLVYTRRSGRPRGGHDLIIAATARATGRSVVTSDTLAFEGLPGVKAVVYSR